LTHLKCNRSKQSSTVAIAAAKVGLYRPCITVKKRGCFDSIWLPQFSISGVTLPALHFKQ